MRLGTKIPWPYSCTLCGRGYGESTKVISMAVSISLDKSEGITTDVFKVLQGQHGSEVTICTLCINQPIFKLVLYLTGGNS